MTLGQGATIVAVAALALLLVVRIALAVRNWIRHARHPEARKILVVGVGGGGSNAVDRMVRARIRGVSFAAINTDAQALRRSSAPKRIRIGDSVTHGLGSGGDPEVGQKAAEEDRARLVNAVARADLVFVTAGLGGGTGSGAAPVVAAAAREGGALTIAVATKPFGWEGVERRRIADAAADRLAGTVDALIIVPNDRVGEVVAADASLVDAFRAVDDVLLWAARGIIGLTTTPGLVNVDFADIRSVLLNAGPTHIGVGRGGGQDRAIEAAREAVAGSLLEATIQGATRILFNLAGPPDLRFDEVRRAAEEIRAHADPEANVIFGATIDPRLDTDVVITVIAAGLEERRVAERPAADAPPAPARAALGPPAEAAATGSSNGARSRVAGRDTPLRTVTVPAPAKAASTRGRARATDAAEQPSPSSGAPGSPAVSGGAEATDADADDLDIPSFIRRRQQAAASQPQE
jgi:cell division protein FtsZ